MVGFENHCATGSIQAIYRHKKNRFSGDAILARPPADIVRLPQPDDFTQKQDPSYPPVEMFCKSPLHMGKSPVNLARTDPGDYSRGELFVLDEKNF
jgi:hypothetical protein